MKKSQKIFALIFSLSLLACDPLLAEDSEHDQSTSITDDVKYRQLCHLAATDELMFSLFKGEPIYQQMVNNVSYEQGLNCLSVIETKYPDLLNLWSKFAINDRIGGPVTYLFPSVGRASPSTLRYIKILGELRSTFGDLTNKKIVEVGGGYGGQAQVISNLFDFSEYVIVDLPEPVTLIEKYLSTMGIENIRYIPSNEVQEEYSDLFISNFAFSECNRDVQDEYLEKYILNSSAGYMLLNDMRGFFTPSPYTVLELRNILRSYGYQVTIKPEDPRTGHYNIVLIWKKSNDV